MLTVLLLLSFATVSLAVFLAGEAVMLPARERRATLRRALERHGPAVPGQVSFRRRVVAPFGARLARLVLRLSPRTSLDSVAFRLLAAGRRDTSPTAFLAVKGASALAGVILGLLVGAASGPAAGLIFALAFGLGGFIAPDFLLSSRTRRRRERIQADLPDALDLLAVSVEAGLGFDGAMAKLAQHLDGPLVEELALLLAEMRMGQSRHEALRKLADRVDAPEMTAFTSAVIQADRLGISLGGILRVQADDTRARRQTAAEEKAMKAPVKMLFPTVLFIFPSMFVVILGPALLNFQKIFS